MITVRKAFGGDADRVLPLLREFRTPYVRDEQWRRLFADLWGEGLGYFGYLMLDGDEAVGFFGLLFSHRNLRGRTQRICHFTSWIVREPYRGRCLFLLQPVLREEDTTFVDLTPSREVYALLRRAGFSDFETHRRLLFPGKASGAAPVLRFVPDEIESRLDPGQARILQDHSFPGCWHVLVETGGGSCYIVLNRIARRTAPFLVASVLYASDITLFRDVVGRIVGPVCLRLKVLALSVDERLLGGRRIPFSVPRALEQPRVFKSESLSGGDLDALYSEFPVLQV